MGDDEADPELLELLRAALGQNQVKEVGLGRDTGVLESARYIVDNSTDVAIDFISTKRAARKLMTRLKKTDYSPSKAYNDNVLHPQLGKDMDANSLANFVFTMDCLNFCFWSELPESSRYQVEYRGERWTGYMSLVACLRRALDEEIPITTPKFWQSEVFSPELVAYIFRSATEEEIPLLVERHSILREAGQILQHRNNQEENMSENDQIDAAFTNNDLESAKSSSTIAQSNRHSTQPFPSIHPDSSSIPIEELKLKVKEWLQASQSIDNSITQLIEQSERSAGRLVNLLAQEFPSFRDEGRFDGRKVRFLKRAQIFVADLYSAFGGSDLGSFDDIDTLTMFADYRVPQQLSRMAILRYCPALEVQLNQGQILTNGSSWEMQIRGASIHAVELLKREICQQSNGQHVTAMLLDFLLYTISKEYEQTGIGLPHHRTRSIWY